MCGGKTFISRDNLSIIPILGRTYFAVGILAIFRDHHRLSSVGRDLSGFLNFGTNLEIAEEKTYVRPFLWAS